MIQHVKYFPLGASSMDLHSKTEQSSWNKVEEIRGQSSK